QHLTDGAVNVRPVGNAHLPRCAVRVRRVAVGDLAVRELGVGELGVVVVGVLDVGPVAASVGLFDRGLVDGRLAGTGHSAEPRTRATVWAPRRVLPRHKVRPHQRNRTRTAPTDKAMATADVDRDRPVRWPPARTRFPCGLSRVTWIWKSPDARDDMLTYTAL